jgi:hypothetical protein
MNYEIDTHVLNMTTDCSDYFSCLSGEDTCLCEVEKIIGSNGGLLYIKHNSNIKSCKYELFYGDSFICNCPTRREMYRKYNV